jgi:hypothetical protein
LCNASFEVLHETRNRAVVILVVVGRDTSCKLAGNRPARRPVRRASGEIASRTNATAASPKPK